MVKTKIVITGASGFIGKDLLKQLDVNAFDVTIVTRNKDKFNGHFTKSITIVEADLLTLHSLVAAFNQQDILVNLAAEVRNSDLLEATNVQGTKNIIQAIHQTSVSKVIHLSSVGVVGKGYSQLPLLVDENTIASPANEYERTKWVSEQLFLEAAANGDFELAVLRPTNVFGENHPFNALLNLLGKIVSKKPLFYSSGAMVNYVYVSDLNAFIVHLIKTNHFKRIYNVGKSIQLDAFYQLLMNELAIKTRIIKVPTILIKLAKFLRIKKLQPISNKVSYVDQKLEDTFHYTFGLEKGIKKTVDHFKKRELLQ
jgi:nucleoside-diphosphate-sugar epimerase